MLGGANPENARIVGVFRCIAEENLSPVLNESHRRQKHSCHRCIVGIAALTRKNKGKNKGTLCVFGSKMWVKIQSVTIQI